MQLQPQSDQYPAPVIGLMEFEGEPSNEDLQAIEDEGEQQIIWVEDMMVPVDRCEICDRTRELHNGICDRCHSDVVEHAA